MTNKVMTVPFEAIDVDESFNPRGTYDNIDSLAASIKEQGLLQPIGVHKKRSGKFSLRFGFRRHRALSQLREETPGAYKEVPVVVIKGTSDDQQIANLIENLERENLKADEYDKAIVRLANLGLTQREIADRIGRPQSWVSGHFKTGSMLGVAARKAYGDGVITHQAAKLIADMPEDTQESLMPGFLETLADKGSRAMMKQIREARAPFVDKSEKKGQSKARFTTARIEQALEDTWVQHNGPVASKTDKAFFQGVFAVLDAMRQGDFALVDDLDPANNYMKNFQNENESNDDND